jgi:hypothetical protein
LSRTTNTYSGTTLVSDGTNASTLRGGDTNAFSANSAVQVSKLSTLDLGGFNQNIFSLSEGTNGGGTITNNGSADAILIVRGGATSAFSGAIADGAKTTRLNVANGNALTLTGINTYTGATTVNGLLQVDGSISASSTAVNSGGVLTGLGTLGTTLVDAGGTLLPGRRDTAEFNLQLKGVGQATRLAYAPTAFRN